MDLFRAPPPYRYLCHLLNLFRRTLYTPIGPTSLSSSTWVQAAPARSGVVSPYAVIVRYANWGPRGWPCPAGVGGDLPLSHRPMSTRSVRTLAAQRRCEAAFVCSSGANTGAFHSPHFASSARRVPSIFQPNPWQIDCCSSILSVTKSATVHSKRRA